MPQQITITVSIILLALSIVNVRVDAELVDSFEHERNKNRDQVWTLHSPPNSYHQPDIKRKGFRKTTSSSSSNSTGSTNNNSVASSSSSSYLSGRDQDDNTGEVVACVLVPIFILTVIFFAILELHTRDRLARFSGAGGTLIILSSGGEDSNKSSSSSLSARPSDGDTNPLTAATQNSSSR